MIFVTKNRVLVKLHSNDDRSRSGRIIIPREAQNPSFLATVCACGPMQAQVKVGDTVVISNSAGIEVPIDGEKYIMLDNFELLAIIEDGVEFVCGEYEHKFETVAIVTYRQCVCGAVDRSVTEYPKFH